LTSSLGWTVVRTRGIMWATPQTFASQQGFRIAAKVDDATEVASAEIDGPVTVPNDNWFLFEPFNFQNVGDGTAAGRNWQVDMLQRRIDVRSKRKLPEIADTAILYAEAGSATAWVYGFDLSILLAMS